MQKKREKLKVKKGKEESQIESGSLSFVNHAIRQASC